MPRWVWTTGVVYPSSPTMKRKAAYRCDVTYATNNELGFDYLRDNMKTDLAPSPISPRPQFRRSSTRWTAS